MFIIIIIFVYYPASGTSFPGLLDIMNDKKNTN